MLDEKIVLFGILNTEGQVLTLGSKGLLINTPYICG